MRFIADFHIHSHYSRATTPQLTPENLDYWSRLKGIHVMGTGDCIHPGWFDELSSRLEPAGNGLYRLKPAFLHPAVSGSRLAERPLQFLLTTEISSIYKKAGKVRKVHTICVLPDFDAARRFQERLAAIGNIRSDGRPILGLDAKHVLEILLESSPDAYLIPAHIWTPWFSVLGSQSGFDSLEECFDDLTPQIFAVETGLSSDPPMNRVCSFLDGVRLVSNSDAHSPEKLGREANVFDTRLGYDGIARALRHDDGFVGTIEFFPAEGKYHYDGHRKCGVRWNPLETLRHRGLCSGCGKPVTRGVMYRVAQLADRPQPLLGKQRHWSITPLPELVAEALGQKSVTSQSVRRLYRQLLDRLGTEFDILLTLELEEIERASGDLLAEGIRRLRSGEVSVEEGYDGEFGKIRVFKDRRDPRHHEALFATGAPARDVAVAGRGIEFDIAEFQRRLREDGPLVPAVAATAPDPDAEEPSTEKAAASNSGVAKQREAIEFGEGVCVVLAGPGSGKTHALTERIVSLVEQRRVPAEQILALTFSNKAADEMRDRVAAKSAAATAATICTFHAFGLSVLREHAPQIGYSEALAIADDEERGALVRSLVVGEARRASSTLREISAVKQGIRESPSGELARVLDAYQHALRAQQMVDLDDLIWLPVALCRDHPPIRAGLRARYRWIFVDEYQDINARQYELIRVLAGGARPNLFAIGDPDQAIYGFRGSDARFIERLLADYPEARVIRLSTSYRCPDAILKGAGQILQKRDALTGQLGSVKIHLQQCATDRSEAEWIAGAIERMIGGVRSLSLHSGMSDGTADEVVASFRDFAVLCRTSAMFEPFMEAFAHHGIACQIVGETPFYRREPWASALRDLRRAVQQRADAKPEAVAMIAQQQPIAEIIQRVVADGEAPEAEARRIEQLAAPFAARYADFLRTLALRQAVDDYERRAERVSLMTMHASKGLEFQVVFIPGCEEGLIPFEQFGKKSAAELAEEERLFYVAMTRTKRYLFLTYAQRRAYRGKILTPARSALLDRIERELMQLARQDAKKAVKDDYTQLSIWS